MKVYPYISSSKSSSSCKTLSTCMILMRTVSNACLTLRSIYCLDFLLQFFKLKLKAVSLLSDTDGLSFILLFDLLVRNYRPLHVYYIFTLCLCVQYNFTNF